MHEMEKHIAPTETNTDIFASRLCMLVILKEKRSIH